MSTSLEEDIDAAMALFDRIDRLTQQPDARTEIGEMLPRFEPPHVAPLPADPTRQAAEACFTGRTD